MRRLLVEAQGARHTAQFSVTADFQGVMGWRSVFASSAITMTLTVLVTGGFKLRIVRRCSPTGTARLKIGDAPRGFPLSTIESHVGKQMIVRVPVALASTGTVRRGTASAGWACSDRVR